MFVKSNMSREVKYRKSKGIVVLKPGTVTFVDDNIVTAKELKDCYGDRINIMSRETVERYIVETAPKVEEDIVEEVEEPKVEEPKVEEPKEDEGVIAGGAAPINPIIELEDVVGEVKVEELVEVKVEEPKQEELVSNTGNEEIDAFLNGETDKVPEGTVEIPEEEALKLQEEVKAEESQPVKKPVGKKPGKKIAGKKAVKASKN